MFQINAEDVCRPFKKGDEVNLEVMLRNRQLERTGALKHIGDGHLNEGVVHGIGNVASVSKMENGGREILIVANKDVLEGVSEGNLLSIDGVSMTARGIDPSDNNTIGLTIQAWPGAAMTTTLGGLTQGASVNIGRALVPRKHAPNP
jgi:hypothetical protein